MDTECSQTYEYDLGEEKSAYIYQNDLKYIKHNNIDITKIKNLPKDYDFSTIETRINDCIKNNCELLDLNHLELHEFPTIIKQHSHLHNIKYLFISNNNIDSIPNLNFFKHLLVIDLANNNLSSVPNLPSTIEELTVKNNKIKHENLDKYKFLKRLNISSNELIDISIIDSLEILICDDNNLKKINTYPKLKKLSCERNNIKIICSSPNLKIIGCDENNITSILNFPKLKELYCNDNDITTINDLPLIHILYCIHNKIKTIEYFSTLHELVCDYHYSISITTMYNVKHSHVYNDYICITF